jgi:hypothetical protein
MKEIKRTLLLRGTEEQVRVSREELGKILEGAGRGLKASEIAGIEMAKDFDGTVVCSFVVKEFESVEERNKFMAKLSKAKEQ